MTMPMKTWVRTSAIALTTGLLCGRDGSTRQLAGGDGLISCDERESLAIETPALEEPFEHPEFAEEGGDVHVSPFPGGTDDGAFGVEGRGLVNWSKARSWWPTSMGLTRFRRAALAFSIVMVVASG